MQWLKRRETLFPKRRAGGVAGGKCRLAFSIDLFEIILVIEGEFMLLLICKRKILNALVLIFR